MAPRTTYANLADGLQPFSLWDQSLADMGSLGHIPCTAVGTNAIVLTPIASVFAPNITNPQALQTFSFVAVANSTASVTIQVGSSGALKLYRMDGVTQATTDLVSGATYLVNYNAALNSAAGGFQILAPISNIINPVISGATITNSTYNGNIITPGTGTLTLGAVASATVAPGKALVVNNSLTFAGTDGTTVTLPTTNATLARTDAGQTFTGANAFSALTATSFNKVTITAPATSATLTLLDGTVLTGPAVSGTAMTLGNTETVSGAKTFTNLVTVAAGVLDIATLGNAAFPNAMTINSQGDICVGGYLTPDSTHHLSFEIQRNQNTDAAFTLRNRSAGASSRAVFHFFAGASDEVDVGITAASTAGGGNVNMTTNTVGGGGFNFIQAANDKITWYTNNTQRLSLTAAGVMQFEAPSVAANGAVATSLGSVGPTGSRTTVQKWLKINDSSGNPFYIPLF